MSTDLSLQDDMDTVFLTSGFQETVSYTPSGGTAKSISAIVNRGGGNEGPQPPARGGSPERRFDMEIIISTDETNGVATVKPREDKVSVATTPGGSAQTYLVVAVIRSDVGAWHLGLGN